MTYRGRHSQYSNPPIVRSPMHQDGGHMDYADTQVVIGNNNINTNYCDNDKCWYHWTSRGGNDVMVKEIGVCTRYWGKDPGEKCPHYNYQGELRSFHADSVT